MRCAICFVPPPEDALSIAAARWLRRDVYSGARIQWPVEGLVDADHAFLTAAPRRKGFHGSLKAPFRLAEQFSVDDLAAAMDSFCQSMPEVRAEATRIVLMHNFFALVPAAPCPELDDLAEEVVTSFDSFRAPMTEFDLARSDIGRLGTRQFTHLMQWGHPHVLDQFRFHMTLTGPIDELERDHVELTLQRHFGALGRQPLAVSQLALLVEPEPNAPLLVRSVHQLSQKTHRRIA